MNHNYSPRLRRVVTYGVVGLWAVSVSLQMASSVFGFTWVAPAGLNEIGTGVVMAILAKNHQTNREEKGVDTDKDDVTTSSGGPDAPETEGDE